MQRMDHDSANTSETVCEAVAPNGEYPDAAFVDAMAAHNEGAVEMAGVALDKGENPNLRAVAEPGAASSWGPVAALRQTAARSGKRPKVEFVACR